MKFSDFFWPDSSLEQVSIRYDVAELIIWNCNTNCKVIVQCKGFIGMTDLCIWDDQIILQAECQNIPWPDVIHSNNISRRAGPYPWFSDANRVSRASWV